MPIGSITNEDREFVEVWEHISAQRWGIIRFDARGEEKAEVITGSSHFRITTEERLVTEDRIKRSDDDPFKNGAFRPVVVPDSITIETNPNALSDAEIREILVASDIAFQENLETIDSVATFRRMLEIAETVDDLTMKRYKTLEQRLELLRGRPQLEVKDETLKNFLDESPGARRGAGGMSANYR
jgi:hypothetical protein